MLNVVSWKHYTSSCSLIELPDVPYPYESRIDRYRFPHYASQLPFLESSTTCVLSGARRASMSSTVTSCSLSLKRYCTRRLLASPIQGSWSATCQSGGSVHVDDLRRIQGYYTRNIGISSCGINRSMSTYLWSSSWNMQMSVLNKRLHRDRDIRNLILFALDLSHAEWRKGRG
jgi:hypothetical protein